MRVVVIIPTYNERENILLLLTRLKEAVTPVKKHTVSYLVVDDTSPDGTARDVQTYQKKHPEVSLIQGKKEGLGKALLRGMTYASETMHADIIVQMDADFSHDPLSIPSFLAQIDRGADFVVGSRYIPGGSIPDNWGLSRKIYSVLGNAIVRYGLGFLSVRDWTGGFRAYKRKFFDLSRKDMAAFSGYLFQIAFLHKSLLHGAHVVEVPIQFTDRRFGHSKIAPSEYIRSILLYISRERWKSIRSGSFGKFVVVGTIGFIINTVILEIAVRFGHSPTFGSVLGAEIAIMSNYFLNNNWTFRHKRVTGVKFFQKFIQFNMTSVGAIVIQAASVWLGTMMFGAPSYRLFYLLGVGIGLVWNYIMYSKVIWKSS